MVTLNDVSGMNGSDAAAFVVAVTYAGFAVVGAVLIVIDLRSHRLPNRIVLPSIVAAIVLLLAASVLGDQWPSLGRALLSAALLGGFYLLLRLMQPGGMGGGDVKLAVLVGLLLGWAGWVPLVVGAFAAFVLGAAVALVLIVARRATAASHIAFGPWMIAGAWAGLFFA